MKKGSAWRILNGTIHEFLEDRVFRLSAALAYYAIFSMGPLLLVVMGIAGLVFGEENVRHQVEHQLQDLMGAKVAESLAPLMTARHERASILATLIGGLALLIGASGVFGQLQDSLNTIWEVKPKPGGGLRRFIRDRFLSMAMVLGIGFLLLVSMVLTTFLEALGGYVGGLVSLPAWLAQIFNLLVSVVFIAFLFAAIFKFLPDATVRWRDVWVGALGTALLFTLGKFLLALYLGRESTTSAYGAAGSLVVILLYVYYSSLILFLGAEFTQVYAKQRGSYIVPSPNAEAATEETRAEEGIPHETRRSGLRKQPSKKIKHQNPVVQSRLTPGMVLKENPWLSMGLSLTAGLIAAFLWKAARLRHVLRLYSKIRGRV